MCPGIWDPFRGRILDEPRLPERVEPPFWGGPLSGGGGIVVHGRLPPVMNSTSATRRPHPAYPPTANGMDLDY